MGVLVTMGPLFLTESGGALHPHRLSYLVAQYVRKANVGVKGACPLFRHAAATHMLEGGADVRFVQEMLGHAKLSTTQLYTHVSIVKLKAVHAATRPGALLDASKEEAARLEARVSLPFGWAVPAFREGTCNGRRWAWVHGARVAKKQSVQGAAASDAAAKAGEGGPMVGPRRGR